MHYDFAELSVADSYKLLTSVVVPRPIAWVSTLNLEGEGVNLAPYSFFNALGSDPALVAFSPGDRADGTPKDTARNIAGKDGLGGGEFVVNLVSEELAEAMNVSATDFPVNMDEAGVAGLELTPGVRVRVPHVAASPVSLECREVQTLRIGRNRVVLGEVLGLNIRDELMLDPERHYVDTPALRLIGRMGGRGGYTRTGDTFELARIPYATWLEEQAKGRK
ncbi:flavin reductase family protein [Deinococcus altitudinis]|uniref:flavin reductase family protein n=1 Tax=Deinococcus altitudinis TaxID=468914 RepID=UPI003892A85E